MPRRTVIAPAPAVLLAVAVASTLPVPASVNAFASEKRVVAQGRVVSPAGEGMAGWPVVLIATQRYIELKRFSSGGDVVVAARATTDASGYFLIDIPKDRHFQFWFLRFREPGHFDPVRYLPPDDLEITAEARRGRVASVEMVVRQHPDWPEVERRVAESGGRETEKGRILLTLGLPEKTVRDEAGGTEEWWYFTRGIVYTFRGNEPIGSRSFDPVRPPPGLGPGASGGEGR